jgi:hypothetical protein
MGEYWQSAIGAFAVLGGAALDTWVSIDRVPSEHLLY